MSDKPVMTKNEVEAFGSKLDALGQQLNPTEQALLRHILLRSAAAKESDVEGYGLIPPQMNSFSTIFGEDNFWETQGIIIVGG